jgi:hypothetical protein
MGKIPLQIIMHQKEEGRKVVAKQFCPSLQDDRAKGGTFSH